MRGKKIREPSAEEMEFYDYLPTGRNNAWSYDRIGLALGYDRRTVRRMVEVLICNGYAICNLQNGKGFFKPDTGEDVEIMLQLTNSRIKSLSRKKYALIQALKPFKYANKGLINEN